MIHFQQEKSSFMMPKSGELEILTTFYSSISHCFSLLASHHVSGGLMVKDPPAHVLTQISSSRVTNIHTVAFMEVTSDHDSPSLPIPLNNPRVFLLDRAES